MSTIIAPNAPTAVTYVIDGGGSVITTGIKGDLTIPFSGTITAVDVLADQVGSIVIDIWRDITGNYPPTVADSITAADKPTLIGVSFSSSTALVGWNNLIAAGDTFRFNVDSVTTVTRVTITLTVIKS